MENIIQNGYASVEKKEAESKSIVQNGYASMEKVEPKSTVPKRWVQ